MAPRRQSQLTAPDKGSTVHVRADPVGQGPAAYRAALDAMIKQIDALPSVLQ